MSTTAAAAADDNNDDNGLIPLRSWMGIETYKTFDPTDQNDSISSPPQNNSNITCSKESIIRKTTVAYGILELLLRSKNNNDDDDGTLGQDDVIRIDNFAVHVSQKSLEPHQQPWDDIKGVSMMTPRLSLTIEEPAYLSCLLEPEEKHEQWGRYLEVEQVVTSAEPSEAVAAAGADCDTASENERVGNHRCYYLAAKVLYELLANEAFPEDSTAASTEEPARKKAKSSHHLLSQHAKGEGGFDMAAIPFQMPSVVRMQKLGIPSSLCLMTQNLLESASTGDDDQSSHDAYKSLRDVAQDLHLLLLDPDRFLFDNEVQNTENMQLRYRKEKLYGRDKEETLITDAFCRVSRGKSEAFFIGGFSGSGKSMLVDTLRVSVKNVGGYVIKHKFDAISQDRPLSGVVAAVDRLCRMVKARITPRHLAALVEKLRAEFGADIVLLARIVHSVSVLSPEFVSPVVEEETGGGDKMNTRSVSFTLLRFMRLISSPKRPVMVSYNVPIAKIRFFCLLSKERNSPLFFLCSVAAVFGRLAVG